MRAHYESELRETLWALNRTVVREIARGQGPRTGRRRRRRGATILRPTGAYASAPASGPTAQVVAPAPLATPVPELATRAELAPPREALLVKTLLNHPWLIEEHAEEIAALTLTSPPLAGLRDAILGTQAVDNTLDRARLRSQLSGTGLDKVVDLVERSVTHKSDRFAEPEAPRAEVEVGWRHALALHERQVGLQKSLEAAVQACHRDGSEDALARICEIQGLLARASVQACVRRLTR